MWDKYFWSERKIKNLTLHFSTRTVGKIWYNYLNVRIQLNLIWYLLLWKKIWPGRKTHRPFPTINIWSISKHDVFDGLSYLTNSTGTGNNLRTKRPKYSLYRTIWPKSVLWYISSHRETLSMSNIEPKWRLYRFKKVFDGQCTGQKTQMLPVSHENTYIIELKSHI